jgi:hypothetical protein
MTAIPERRHTPDELPGNSRARVAVAPNAGFAKQVGPADLPLSVGDWLITLIVLAIPLLNIILYVYWAFFSNGNRSRINFCRASLILALVGIFLALLLGGLS